MLIGFRNIRAGAGILMVCALTIPSHGQITSPALTSALSGVEIDVTPGEISESGTAEFMIGGVMHTVRLEPVSVRSRGFRVLTSAEDGYNAVEPPPSVAVRGEVLGDPGSSVAGAVRDGRAELMVTLGDGSVHEITPVLSPLGAISHASIPDPDQIGEEATCACGAEGSAMAANPQVSLPTAPTPELSTDGAPQADSGSMVRIELSLDVDNRVYRQLGNNVEDVTAFVETIVTGVDQVFMNDFNTTVEIKTLMLRTSRNDDPYTQITGSFNLLNALKNEWETNLVDERGDLVHAFSDISFTNPNGTPVGQAFLSGLCTDERYGVNKILSQDTLTRRIQLLAHEMGHGLSVLHCNVPADNNYFPGDCHIMCTSIGSCDGPGQPNFGQGSVPIMSSFIQANINSTCLDVLAACIADLSGDGGPDVNDILLLLNAITTGDLQTGDFDTSGILDSFDVAAFNEALEQCL